MVVGGVSGVGRRDSGTGDVPGHAVSCGSSTGAEGETAVASEPRERAAVFFCGRAPQKIKCGASSIFGRRLIGRFFCFLFSAVRANKSPERSAAALSRRPSR